MNHRRCARRLFTIGATVLAAAAPCSTASDRSLTFEERVAAQEAIERVYYSHQIGAKLPFEDAVPPQLLARKVQAYLQQSAALETIRGTLVTREMLRAEWEKIARDTRLPDRLREVYHALRDDPFLIQECLVRPVLVGRMARERFTPEDASDATWESWWHAAAGSLDERSVEAVADPEALIPLRRDLAPAAAPGGAHAAGTEALATSCAPDDTWSPTTTVAAFYWRHGHAAIWTGSLMLVFGGNSNSGYVGERYDPATDAWSPMSGVGSPATHTESLTAVWTGRYMLVYGGVDCAVGCSRVSGRYDPVSDAWSPISTAGAPGGRWKHSAVWTGRYMIVWGGYPGTRVFDVPVGTGGRYDPDADAWTPTSTPGAPSARAGQAAVWTGSRMIVWGGWNAGGGTPSSGGRYDPATDTWSSTSTVGAPLPRYNDDVNVQAIWTGSRMVVWGGKNGGTLLATGGRYNPVTDTWSPTSIGGAPEARQDHTAVWTGHEMVIFGGSDVSTYLATGGRYDPLTDHWAPTAVVGAPSARERHTAIWTGSDMVVWGGWGGYPAVNPGDRYAVGQQSDDDGDGFSECAGDCDDTRADIHPGVPEVCDGRDDDCDGIIPPEGTDADGDGVRDCAGDCDDHDPTRYPGNLEICDVVDNDCDGVIDGEPTRCGVGGCSATGVCVGGVDSCIPGSGSAEVCDGIDDDCNGLLPDGEADFDGDGSMACAGDCDDGTPVTYPGATEANDTVDNQCPGDAGFGIVDEVSGATGFLTPGNTARYGWPAQAGAAEYEALRSARPDFESGCAATIGPATFWDDPEAPTSRAALYYLVRPTRPHAGSLGRRSSGAERAAVCGAELVCDDGVDDDGDGLVDCADLADCYRVAGCTSATFSFTDTAGDDAATESLAALFAAAPETSDFIHFRLSGPTLTDFETCATRADFYASSYLALAPAAGTIASGSWDKWYRLEGGGWVGPDSASYDNLFGDDCAGAYSWCPEVGLGGHIPGIAPAEPGICEAFDNITCSDGTWKLTITLAVDRLSACGF